MKGKLFSLQITFKDCTKEIYKYFLSIYRYLISLRDITKSFFQCLKTTASYFLFSICLLLDTFGRCTNCIFSDRANLSRQKITHIYVIFLCYEQTSKITASWQRIGSPVLWGIFNHNLPYFVSTLGISTNDTFKKVFIILVNWQIATGIILTKRNRYQCQNICNRTNLLGLQGPFWTCFFKHHFYQTFCSLWAFFT